MKFSFFPRFLLPVLPLLLTGCASVSVSNVHPKGTPPRSLPKKIYVREFVAPYDTFHAGREGKDLQEFVKREKHAFARELVAKISKSIAPAILLKDGETPPSGNFWLLEGVYDRVNEGNRALRMGIGFGAGGTKMETRAWISNLSVSPPEIFLKMLTTGGSGMAPGAVAAFTPALVFYWPGAVANAGGAALSGIRTDRERTAREITAVLNQYCHDRGWLSGRYRRPKYLGSVPLQTPEFRMPKVLPEHGE